VGEEVMSNVEYEELMRAQALGALLPEERERLHVLAREAHERAREVAETDAVLHAFAMERELRESVVAAGRPREEADAGLQRLTAVAAGAEQELRARLAHRSDRPAIVGGHAGGPWRRRAGVALLAAAAALLLWYGIGIMGNGLDTAVPDDKVAGGRLQLVLFNPTLTADARTISWAAVGGASGYDVDILDRTGVVVLRRGDDLRKSTAWKLTPDQYGGLLPHRPLRLRVTALDGVDLPFATSGDLELVLR